METKKTYNRYCVVPTCTNTSFKTPEKIFIRSPTAPKERKLWLEAAGRDTNYLSNKSAFFCCEDHFDLPNDMQNWVEYKSIPNSIKRMKRGIVPHKFKNQTYIETEDGDIRLKRQKMEVMLNYPCTSVSTVTSENELEKLDFITNNSQFQNVTTNEITNFIVITEHQDSILNFKSNSEEPKIKSTSSNKATQVRPSYQSKYIQCTPTPSSFKLPIILKNKPLLKAVCQSDENSSDCSSTSYVPSCLEPSNAGSESDVEKRNKFKETCYEVTMNLIKNQPLHYVGVPSNYFYLINTLSEEIRVPPKDILLCLKKCRSNHSFTSLADDFGMSISSASQCFNKVIPLLADSFKKIVFCPKSETIPKNIPHAFRDRYNKIQSIIDCFEIFIEKPQDAVNQSLTWSKYKKNYTMKYLVSCTPDGLINFISKGYGGRISDSYLFEISGYLDVVPFGTHVLANRGFKHVQNLLAQKNCCLIRLPSVESGTKLTKQEILEIKSIAALRIHIDRTIRRFREFKFIQPYACIDHNLVSLIDEVVLIVAALSNLQGSFVVIT